MHRNSINRVSLYRELDTMAASMKAKAPKVHRISGLQIDPNLSYSPIFGQDLAYIKLLFAPADRVVLLRFAANRSQRVVGRQGRNVGACDCRSRSTF